MQSRFKNPPIHIRIRRFVLRTFMSKEGGKERWFVESRKQALSIGALRMIGGRKQRLRCVPVSRLGSPRTWLDFSRGRQELPDGRSPVRSLALTSFSRQPLFLCPGNTLSVGSLFPRFFFADFSASLIPWRFPRCLLKPRDIFEQDSLQRERD